MTKMFGHFFKGWQIAGARSDIIPFALIESSYSWTEMEKKISFNIVHLSSAVLLWLLLYNMFILGLAAALLKVD